MADTLLIQAICQVDTVRGWEYLDDAGKVMNAYDDVFETKRVTPEGLRMGSPRSGPINQAQISSSMIWVSFELPDTPQVVIDQSVKFVTRVAELIHVVASKRMAMRLVHLVPLTDEEMLRLVRSGKLFDIPSLDAQSIRADKFDLAVSTSASAVAKDASVTFRLQQGTRSPEAPTKFPESGLLIDLDVYREPAKSGEIPLVELRKFAADAVPWIRDRVAATTEALRTDGVNG